MEAGRLDEAEGLGEEAVERFPDRPGGYIQRGEAAMRRGDWSLAGRALGGASPGFSRPHGGIRARCRGVDERRPAGRGRGLGRRGGVVLPTCSSAISNGPRWRCSAGIGRRRARFGESFAERFPTGRRLCGRFGGAAARRPPGRGRDLGRRGGEALSPPVQGSYPTGRDRDAPRDWTVASALWGELRRAFPNQVAGYVRGANALMQAGRPDEAEALADEVVKRFPDHPGGYYQRAEIAMRRRDWDAARGLWSEMCRALTDNPAGHVRGMTLMRPRSWFGVGNAHASILLDRIGPLRPASSVTAGQFSSFGATAGLRHGPSRRTCRMMWCSSQWGRISQLTGRRSTVSTTHTAERCWRRLPPRRSCGRGELSVRSRTAGRPRFVAGSSIKATPSGAEGLRSMWMVASARSWTPTTGVPISRVGKGPMDNTDSGAPPRGAGRTDGTRIDVFDADTGRPLRGSPVRIEGGRVVVSGRRRT